MSQFILIFPYDYIILLIIIVISIFSIWKGLIQSILGLLTWVGSILVTLYAYVPFSEYMTSQLMKINFFQNYEILSYIIGLIISVPLIFLISLFLLKKLRKFISSDLDKQILGIIFDKFFGLIYGILFSYIIFSTIIYSFNKIEYLVNFNNWLINNSNIIQNIENINDKYFYDLIKNNEIIE